MVTSNESPNIEGTVLYPDTTVSPTFVLPYDADSRAFNDFRYGDGDAFRFDIDGPLSFPDMNFMLLLQPFGKGFSEFHLNDFLMWPN
ncbi:hypothetical protein K1719_033854 [Acacia pycnantha]|nr:hypothetical protein K1719_033854 [Acacia pycnantha]